MTSSEDGGGLVSVPPSDVLVHGRGGIEEVIEVLRDVADACRRVAEMPVGAGEPSSSTRKFDSLNEFQRVVERLVNGKAAVKLRKLFLYRGMGTVPARCSVMQEIWIQDKHNPDAVRNPLKSYTVAHAHHHCQTRVNRVEDITPEHLAVVDAMNVRHISDWGSAKYQDDNPFFDTYIEPSGRDTLKVFPPDEDWSCRK